MNKIENDPYPWFTKPCLKAYLPLVSEFNFSDPGIRQLAQERYIEYIKSNKKISISFEPGLLPLVEIYFPTFSLNDRRIPKLITPKISELENFNMQLGKLAKQGKYREFDNMVKYATELEEPMYHYLLGQFESLKNSEKFFIDDISI